MTIKQTFIEMVNSEEFQGHPEWLKVIQNEIAKLDRKAQNSKAKKKVDQSPIIQVILDYFTKNPTATPTATELAESVSMLLNERISVSKLSSSVSAICGHKNNPITDAPIRRMNKGKRAWIEVNRQGAE